MNNYGPVSKKMPHILHGGDYNPDQWMETPEIWDEDMYLMKKAGCNAMTVGIFSWSAIEKEEGVFDFSWLDTVMDKIEENDGGIVLATPSGARPAWLDKKYPEVLRVAPNRVRNLHGGRHNHCYTSPVYRQKVKIINEKLAERYKDRKGLLVWHLSNEYSGECHCELCQNAFREWLKVKYNNNLKKLNHEWWTSFWSHTFTSWDEIESPAPHGEVRLHGLVLDWKRFVTYQTVDFIKEEMKTLRRITPDIPITTNLMGTYPGLDYFKIAEVIDLVSWDSYPNWTGNEEDITLAANTAFTHDLNRSFKGGRPFMLMESTPSVVNWGLVNKLKRPGMHKASSLLAIAHGSDTVQYFQWRKSRGSSEKFHGAVVDHYGKEDTRVFNEVSELGEALKKLDAVVGTGVKAQVAIVFDWDNRWALESIEGLRKDKKDVENMCRQFYKPLWEQGVAVDVIDMEQDFSSYDLIIAPMLYMIKQGVGEKIDRFVENGGTFVTTYFSGIVNENDLCFLGGFPGPLKETLGLRAEEIDSLYDEDKNWCVVEENDLGLSGEYEICTYCDLVIENGAKVIARYKEDFYKQRPCLLENKRGKGTAYYIAFRDKGDFTRDFIDALAIKLSLKRAIDIPLPMGVCASRREDEKNSFVFLQNFNHKQAEITLDKSYKEIITGRLLEGAVTLKSYETFVLSPV